MAMALGQSFLRMNWFVEVLQSLLLRSCFRNALSLACSMPIPSNSARRSLRIMATPGRDFLDVPQV